MKEHAWLRGINWSDIYRKEVETPYRPREGDNFDAGYCNRIDPIEKTYDYYLQKINNEIKKRNELESFQAKQADLTSQILIQKENLKKTTDEAKKQEIRSSIDSLIRQTTETENNYKASTLAIDANNLSLSIQEQQIGKVIESYM